MADASDDKQWTPDQIRFQAWLSLPSAARQPRQQRHLAAELGHGEPTLSRWKQLPGWHDAVYALALDHVIGDLVPVLHAQVAQAKRGSLPHAQWLFEVCGKWTPTTRQQHANAPGETFEVIVNARDYREGLTPMLPPADDDG